MAALTAPRTLANLGSAYALSLAFDLNAAGASTLYMGGLAGLTAAGALIPYATGAGNKIVGIVNGSEDGGTVTGSAADPKEVSVEVGGAILENLGTGFVISAVGDPVFFPTDNVDDVTLTVTGHAAGGQGVVTRVNSDGSINVQLRPWDQQGVDA